MTTSPPYRCHTINALHEVHEATFDSVEYLPAAHWLHVVAPAAEPVFVIDPAPQPMHDATFDAVEYLPATHGVQFVAPVATPVSVLEPAAQSEQYDWPPFV